MHQALRPYVTSGIAIVGASVMVAAPLTIPPESLEPPAVQVAIDPAASVTEFVAGLLADYNTVVVAGGNAAQIVVETAGGLPLGISLAAQAIIDNPENTVNVLNFLINSFVSPVPAYNSLFYQFGTDVIGPLIGLLPADLQAVVGGAFAQLGQALFAGLSQLPGNAALGAIAVATAAANLPAPLLNFGLDVEEIGTAIGEGIGGGYTPAPGLLPTNGLAGWLGLAPTVLLATLQAAVDNPSDIPGLASYLAYSLVAAPSPEFPPPNALLPYPAGNYSLFVTTFAPIVAALEHTLPEPLAHALTAVSGVLNEAIAHGLGVLPDPVNPFLPQNDVLELANRQDVSTAATTPDPLDAPGILAAGIAKSGQRLGESTVQGLLGPLALAGAVAGGAPFNQALYAAAEAYVDAPLYIADPTIFAIDDVLPAPVGQDPSTNPRDMYGSGVSKFRADVLIPARDAVKPGLKNVLGVGDPADAGITSSRPKLNVLKVNPLNALGQSDGKRDAGDTEGATDNPGKLFKPLGAGKHALGARGGISVGDLAKKLTAGLDKHKPSTENASENTE